MLCFKTYLFLYSLLFFYGLEESSDVGFVNACQTVSSWADALVSEVL